MRRAGLALAIVLVAETAGAQGAPKPAPAPSPSASAGEDDNAPKRPKKRAEVVDAKTAAEAEKLFYQGRKLMKKRSTLDRGCEVLQRSFDLQKRGDTLLNLAECHRRQNKTATAHREFDEALEYALSAEFDEAVEAAFVLREELAAKLATLAIEVPAPMAKLPGLVVKLDGASIAKSQWGKPVPRDPGPHAVTATAKGYEPFGQDVTLSDADVKAVTIEMVPLPEPVPVPSTEVPKPPEEDQGIPFWVWPVGGAGVAAVAVSVVAGIMALDAGGELDDVCGPERRRCPPDFDADGTRQRELTTFGLFVGFGAAGLGLLGAATGGIIASFVGGSDTARIEVVPVVTPHTAGIAVGGAF